MAHWTAHKAAWFPGSMRICGRKLRPFSLGHLRLFECIESPFFAGGDTTRGDLLAAVALTILPWRVARVVVGNPFLLSWAGWFASRGEGRRWEWREECGAFSEYVEQCLWTPERFEEPGGDADAGVFGFASSLAMRVAMKLANNNFRAVCRRPVRQVWDLGIIEALALSVTLAELGGGHYVTRDEMERATEMAARQVQKEAAENG